MTRSTRLLKTTISTIAILILLTGIGLSTEALARHHQGKPQKMQEVMRQLDLSDTQREQIQTLMQQHREQMPDKGARRAMRTEMQARMQALTTAEVFDQSAAETLAAEKTQMMQQHMVAKMKLHHAIYQVLNSEQQAEFLTLVAERRDAMQERRGKQRGKGNIN